MSHERYDLVILSAALHELNLSDAGVATVHRARAPKSAAAAAPDSVGNASANNPTSSQADLDSMYLSFKDQVRVDICEIIDGWTNGSMNNRLVLDIGCGNMPYGEPLLSGLESGLIARVDLWDNQEDLASATATYMAKIVDAQNARDHNALTVACADRLLPSLSSDESGKYHGEFLGRILRRLHKILKPGARLLIAEFYYPRYMAREDRETIVMKVRELSGHGDPPAAFFDPDVIALEARAAGYAVHRVRRLQSIDPKGREFAILHLDRPEDGNQSADLVDADPASVFNRDIEQACARLLPGADKMRENYVMLREGRLSNAAEALQEIFASEGSASGGGFTFDQLADRLTNVLDNWYELYDLRPPYCTSVWISLSSYLTKTANAKFGRWNPTYGAEKFARGYAYLDEPIGGRSPNKIRYLADIIRSATGAHIPPEEDWVSIAFNDLLAPIKLKLDGQDFAGPSIHSWLAELAGQFSPATDLQNWKKSVCIICSPAGETERAMFRLVARDYRDDRLNQNLVWDWNLDQPNEDFAFRSGASLDAYLNKNLNGHSEAPKFCDGANETEKIIRRSMVSVFLDFLFLSRGVTPQEGYDIEYLKTVRDTKINEFENRWRNNKSLFTITAELTDLDLEQYRCIFPKGYEACISDACRRARNFLSTMIDLTVDMRLPLAWTTIALGRAGTDIPMPSVMVFSDVPLDRRFVEPISSFLRSPIFEWSRQENLILAEVAENQRRDARLKAETAALMARNLSHNVGSHVLASSRLQRVRSDPKMALHQDIKIHIKTVFGEAVFDEPIPPTALCKAIATQFDGYLQRRQDFVALIVEDMNMLAQPRLLWRDVIKPFTEQYALLATMLADQGYGYGPDSKALKFTISFHAPTGNAGPGGNGAVETGCRSRVCGTDQAIGVAGGSVGQQALYAIFENILRNVAKYGTKRGITQELKLDIRLLDIGGNTRYLLEIRDNFGSTEGDPEFQADLNSVITIRRHLANGLRSRDSDAPKIGGHGLREMLACAEFLARDTKIWFEKDETDQSDSCYTRFYQKHKMHLSAREAVLERPTPLRCYHDGLGLVYQIAIPKPRMLGVFDPIAKTELALHCARVFSAVNDLVDYAPMLAVARAPNKVGNTDNWLDALIENQQSLPFRTMIVCVSPEQKCTICRKNPQLYVVSNSQLHNDLGSLTAESWQRVVSNCYEAWLRAYKPPVENQKWNLHVGLERDPVGVQARWKAIDGFESDLVDVFVRAKVAAQDMENGIAIVRMEDFVSMNAKADEKLKSTQIVYDNHHVVFEADYKADVAFSQEIGSSNIELYQQLETPPTDPFGFAMFVYGVIEASLTKVAVLDERLSEAIVDCGNPIGGVMLKSARVYPLFAVGGVRGVDCHVLAQGEWCQDKLDLSTNKLVLFMRAGTSNQVFEVTPEVDVLVIHLGVLEQSVDKTGLTIESDQEKLVRSLRPRVVITSGRGSGREWGRTLPFADFSAIGGALYGGFNKPNLVAALLAASRKEA